jgi:hypothetical protein
MAIGIERPLETIRHVPASPISGIRHGFRCHATSATRSADEEQFGISVCSRRRERITETVRKRRINSAFRRRLPLNRKNLLVYLRQVRETYERPLGPRANVDEHRAFIFREASPDLLHRHILNVDDFHRLHLRPPPHGRPEANLKLSTLQNTSKSKE